MAWPFRGELRLPSRSRGRGPTAGVPPGAPHAGERAGRHCRGEAALSGRSPLPRGERRRLGILTGSGPRAGLDLLDKILRAHEALLGADFQGDKDAPYVASLSAPQVGGPHGSWDTLPDSDGYESLSLAVRDAVLTLAPLVDYLCLACNTLHRFQPQIEALLKERGLSCRFVSIVDTTVQWCSRHGVKEVSILGSRLTADVRGGSPYAAMGRAGFRLAELPEEAVRGQQLALEQIKQLGASADAPRELLQAAVDAAEAGTLVLACTEFPLVNIQTSKTLVDPTALLAQKMASLALGMEDEESNVEGVASKL
mmetsp:Transcript_4967/g.15984  ORF Transcript_4967/g.15984 Transcript_4967/m.15984 type:complete len:311 (+) Transcript_4967:137-1069(+)